MSEVLAQGPYTVTASVNPRTHTPRIRIVLYLNIFFKAPLAVTITITITINFIGSEPELQNARNHDKFIKHNYTGSETKGKQNPARRATPLHTFRQRKEKMAKILKLES